MSNSSSSKREPKKTVPNQLTFKARGPPEETKAGVVGTLIKIYIYGVRTCVRFGGVVAHCERPPIVTKRCEQTRIESDCLPK